MTQELNVKAFQLRRGDYLLDGCRRSRIIDLKGGFMRPTGLVVKIQLALFSIVVAATDDVKILRYE